MVNTVVDVVLYTMVDVLVDALVDAMRDAMVNIMAGVMVDGQSCKAKKTEDRYSWSWNDILSDL